MNNEEKNVMTIVTIGRVIEASLWYCLPPRTGSFSVEERAARGKALQALTAEGSPFAMNCDTNGDAGKDLKEEMQYFIEDVYGENGRIVSVGLDNKVRVESSLILELFNNIVKLRGYIESFLRAALEELKKRNSLEEDFEQLVMTDIRYFHAFAGKISCILLSNKFLEINQMAKTLTENYSKQHGGIDPKRDPEFNVANDPSFRMLENEFHQINADMNAVLNTYGNDGQDDEFKYARESVYADCEIFTGKKQTTDVNAFFNIFNAYFDRILDATQNKLNNMFQEFGKKLQADAPAPAAAPAAEEKAPATEEAK
ncbi:MAG: hypothetical protein K5762_01935 [Bacilli bacterium]|jgi:hypothetical protein|nr:hypothetical protein [Bacilli bacterium]